MTHAHLLLALGANPNAAHDSSTAIGSSVTADNQLPGDTTLMRLLLDYGANPNVTAPKSNLSALFDAALAHRLDMMELLLAHGANPNSLDTAAMLGDTAMLDLLFRYNADPNISSRNIFGQPPLFFAKRPDIAQYLLDRGAQLTTRDELGRSALFSAVDHGSIAMIDFYLRQGFDINERDTQGNTPLFVARDAARGPAVAAYLLQHGAQLAARDPRGRTVLFVAAENEDTELVRFFIAQGLDVNARDPIGRTPLFAAVEPDPYGQFPQIAETLIAQGADVNVIDVDGHSILAEARANKHDTIVELLIAAGAK